MQIKELITYTKNLNVLFVEDDVESRKEITIILNRFFDNVIEAENGAEGIEKFKKYDIDLVITDINMPKLNGLDMISKIKNINPDIISIILSAHNETDYFINAILLGVNGFILKPFVLEQFINTLEKLYKELNLQKQMNEVQYLLSQYQQIVDESIAVCKFNQNKQIIYTNEQFYKIFKYENMQNKYFDDLIYQEDMSHIFNVIENKKMWHGIIKIISENNEIFYSKVIIKPMLNNEKEVIEFIVLFLDVGDILDQKQLLLDYIDKSHQPLIGLVYLVDFDSLRNYFGEKMVRKIILTLEQVLNKNLPKHIDCIYNLNEGKFALVSDLKDTNKDEVIYSLQQYQQNINKMTIAIDNFLYNISSLLSVANGDDVLENAYMGIKELLNNKEIFINANNLNIKEKQEAQNNLKIITLLKNSIENNEIIPYYQALIDNKSQNIIKYEALVRIESDKVYLPGEFLEIAKHSFYYSKITQIVLQNSLETIKNYKVAVSVNISTYDISKENIRESIYSLLDKYKKYTSYLTFEILEDETIENIAIFTEFINKVKSFGITIALDDFGSGYSNFSRVLELKPDILKIDGSLIKNIDNDKYSYNLVKTMVEFAKLNNIQIVAEFVENKIIFDIVHNLGVDYSQGYYFDKPKKRF